MEALKDKESEKKIYTTGWPKCKVLEKKLTENGIKFTKIDDKEEMINKNILNVPVLEIDGKIMGFVEANDWINNCINN